MSLLSMLDLGPEDVEKMLGSCGKVKGSPNKFRNSLADRSLAMIFEKPSTRTRVSFEVAMVELGGHAVVLNAGELQLGRGETVADTARILGSYVDCIMARVRRHETLEELDKHAGVPVINGLSDREHPCQVLGDLFTMMEVKGRLEGLKLAYVGDGNNVCNSLLLGCALCGVDITVASPMEYRPKKFFIEKASKIAGGESTVSVLENPSEAVSDADIVYTDVWTSMGDEDEREHRKTMFRSYQVDSTLMKRAKKDAVFMHCLPAHRGEEVTDGVIDSKQSVVWQQAENRLHAQKAVLLRELK